MRFVHVTQPVEAGVAVVVASLARDQARRGHDVTVVCPPSGLERGPLADLRLEPGVRLVPWPAARAPGPSVLAETFRLRRLLSAADADAVILHSAKAGLAGRLAIRDPHRVVFVPHAWSFEAATGPMRWAVTRWERFAQRWSRVTVCVSSEEKDRASAAGLTVERLVVIDNGVDVDHFAPGDQHEARRHLGIDTAPLAVCVGRLTMQKGQDRLIKAWPLVRRRIPGARLVLVGDGPRRDELIEQSGPGVDLVGPTRDPVVFYRAADVVVFASRWEAGALVPLEAMATGRAVVSVDVTGVRAALASSGTVIQPGDDAAAIEALANAIADRLVDDAGTRERGRLARARAVESYSLQASLSTWAQLMDSVAR